MAPEDEKDVEVLGHSVGERVTVLKSGKVGVIVSIHVGLTGVWFHVVLDGMVNQKRMRWEDFL